MFKRIGLTIATIFLFLGLLNPTTSKSYAQGGGGSGAKITNEGMHPLKHKTAGGWTNNNGNIYTTTSTDNLGIGTTSPQANLDVSGMYYSREITDTVTAGAVTLNWAAGNVHYMVLNSGANTITMTNPQAGLRCLLYLKQPSSGAAGTVTFSPVPYFPNGTAPTLTTTNSAVDLIAFGYSTAIGKYLGGFDLDLK